MLARLLGRRWVGVGLATVVVLLIGAWLILANVIPIGLCWGCPPWQDPFWISFFPGCLAELVGGVIFGAIVALAIQHLGAPQPQARMMLEQIHLPNGSRRLWFRIATTGRIAFRADEIHWDIYLTEPELPGINLHEHNTKLSPSDTVPGKGVTYHHYHGLVRVPLFHGMNLRLFYSDIAADVGLGAKIYYVLSTPYGHVPRRLRRNKYGSIDVASAAVMEPFNIVGVANVTLEPLIAQATAEVSESQPPAS